MYTHGRYRCGPGVQIIVPPSDTAMKMGKGVQMQGADTDADAENGTQRGKIYTDADARTDKG